MDSQHCLIIFKQSIHWGFSYVGLTWIPNRSHIIDTQNSCIYKKFEAYVDGIAKLILYIQDTTL